MADSTERTQDMNEIFAHPEFFNSDRAIVSNALLQGVIAATMLGIFLVARRRAPWLYFPNAWRSPGHPGHGRTGLLAWVAPLLAVNDSALLAIVGLDGFMFLQTLKLLYRVFLVLACTAMPLLCAANFKYSSASHDLFVRLSLWRVESRAVLVLNVAVAYAATALVLYLLFIYYKRFVGLRQLFLRSPAAATSVAKLKQLAQGLPPGCSAIDYVDICTRTVVFERLPPHIRSDDECRAFVEALGLGDVEDAVIIMNTQRLQKLYEERHALVQAIEKEVHRALALMTAEYARVHGRLGPGAGPDLAESAAASAPPVFTIDEKTRLCNTFAAAAEAFLAHRGASCALQFYLQQFRDNERAVEEERRRIHRELATDAADAAQDRAARINVDRSLFIAQDPDDVSFFSLRHFLHPRAHRRLFSLDLPVRRLRAFVTFRDQRAASIAVQAKIGTRVFSCAAEPAPAPHDVIWCNITRSEIACYAGQNISRIAVFALNLMFFYVVTCVIDMLRLTPQPQNYVLRFIARDPLLAAVYTGVLTPLVCNTLLYFVPVIFTALLNMEGVKSYSGFQMRMMLTFALFLFFNAFLSAAFSMTLLDLVRGLSHPDATMQRTLRTLADSIVNSSTFFFNTVVQRLCVGTAMVFLKPGPFLFNFVVAPGITKTRRQQREIEFAPPIDFGNAVPNALLIFPMVFVYMCISPCILVLGVIFYLWSYLAYKNELLYACRNEFEAGGASWGVAVRFILYTVALFQVITAAQTYAAGFPLAALALLPLLAATYMFGAGLGPLFERSCNSFPLNAPEESYLDEFGARAAGERARMLGAWSEAPAAEDPDTLPLAVAKPSAASVQAFYRDPALAANTCQLILPRDFFAITHFLETRDKEQLFGFQ